MCHNNNLYSATTISSTMNLPFNSPIRITKARYAEVRSTHREVSFVSLNKYNNNGRLKRSAGHTDFLVCRTAQIRQPTLPTLKLLRCYTWEPLLITLFTLFCFMKMRCYMTICLSMWNQNCLTIALSVSTLILLRR